ncbi:MAG: HAD family phosphatase [Verrucomicrobia bacterium]|nr:HAD family phosphatase [Verrucomicrobiota bacterium]
MDWIQEYQLFLFDFDGLLVDTEQLHYRAYLEMARHRGCPLNWDFERFCLEAHGKAMGFFDGMQREYPDVFKEGPTKEELYEEKKRLYVEMLQSTRLELMEGALPLINALDERKVKSAVVTNSPKAQIDVIKRALPDLQKIPLWITREDYSAPKPSPEGYLKAIAALAKPGDRIVGFEDTLKGLKALLAAGVDAFLICPSDHKHIGEGISLGAKHCEKLSLLNRTLA